MLDCYDGVGECEYRNITHTVTDCDVWGAWADPETLSCEETREGVEEVSYISDPANHVRAPMTNETYNVELLNYSLDSPWDFTFLPDGSILLTEAAGTVKLLEDGEEQVAGEVEVAGRGNDGFFNVGLLGVAVHPEFESNRYVYLYYTHDYEREHDGPPGKNPVYNRLVRYRLENGSLTGRETVIESIRASGAHGGGRMEFGPDGKLYITTGDGHRHSTTASFDHLDGKILRVNPDGSVPDDNPEGTLVYSAGHRNPQGLAWSPEGQLFASEHGDWRHDEINRIEAGNDYGYPAYQCEESPHITDPGGRNNTPPVFCAREWTMAPSGMSFVDEPGHPWHGDLFVASLRGEHLHRFVMEDGTVQHSEIFFVNTDIEGLTQRFRNVEYHDGALYVIGDYSGMVRIEPVDGGQ